MRTKDIRKAINELNFTKIQAYLNSTGWQMVDIKRDDIGLYNKGDLQVILPIDRGFADYEVRVYEALCNIAKSENREEGQLLTDLLLPPSDNVRFRVSNRDTLSGTISFNAGFTLLENAKKALFTTACDIIQPEKYHKRLGLKGAQQFIEECKLGQTERGSYITSIICPFINETQEDKPQQLSLFDTSDELRQSLTRRVTSRMMDKLLLIKNSIDTNNKNKIVDLEGENIISANFIESVCELTSINQDSEIDITTSWSAFAGGYNRLPETVKFTNDYVPVLENVIKQIKPYEESEITDVFIGRISQVKADPDSNSRTEGEIIFNFIKGNEEQVAKAKVILNAQQYADACEAHKNGSTISIKGKLIENGRSKSISSVEKFSVIQIDN